MARRSGPVFVVGVVVGVALGALGTLATLLFATDVFAPDPVAAVVAPDQALAVATPGVAVDVPEAEPVDRTVGVYAGHGAWVDVFDYDPAYTDGEPAIVPADVDDMAGHGVETLYLQAARLDERTPDGLVSPLLLYRFLERAHANDVDVVAWYLPEFGDVDADVARVDLLADYDVFGQRFDGVALDIEDTSTVPDVADRNGRFVDVSRRSAELLGETPLGAIVLPPVLTEVVNTDYWPEFPWAEIAGSYDVWLPMSYWTFRTEDSGFQDGYAYNEESTRRLRENLDDPGALVHGIGGLAEDVTDGGLEAFARSLADTGSIGGSIYDWATLSPEHRDRMGQLFADGPASDLAAP